jgi:hypothetical protein
MTPLVLALASVSLSLGRHTYCGTLEQEAEVKFEPKQQNVRCCTVRISTVRSKLQEKRCDMSNLSQDKPDSVGVSLCTNQKIYR